MDNFKLHEISYKGDFINGKFIPVINSDGVLRDTSPADLDDQIMTVPFRRDNVEEACAAARDAYPLWATLPMETRCSYLLKLKDIYNQNIDQMAQLISRDSGKPLWEGINEARNLGSKIDVTIKHSLNLIKEERIENAIPGVDGVIRYRSRGVMAVIGPFNFPAHLPNGQIIPALIAGNTVVFKPSEHTPAVGQFMAELFEKANFPAGVFNLVQGDGGTGNILVRSHNVDGILFVGSYDVGLKIKEATLTHSWKILALEMGGKNSTVVWDDADLDKSIHETLIGAFMSSGQRCSGTSRIILHPKIADEFITKFHKAAKKLAIGHWSENPFMGALINQQAVDSYLRFQQIALREGAEKIMRGKVLELKHKGFYVSPSIYLVNKHNPESFYQKCEIFGPNVAVYITDDFDVAMGIANSSGFGLAMALFTRRVDLYKQAQFKARVGLLNWNRTTNGSSARMPFGGMGKSGNDRPSSHFSIQYCTIPVASLEDKNEFDVSKAELPGMNYEKIE